VSAEILLPEGFTFGANGFTVRDMPSKGTAVIAFRLQAEIIAALDRAAEKRGLTRTQMVAALFAETYEKGADAINAPTPATPSL
jgi:hypothetical protein